MDTNLFSQIASGIGMAGGLWALVRWAEERKSNGNGHEPPNPLKDLPDWVIARDIALKELVEGMANRNRDFMDRIGQLVEIERAPQPDPAWVKDLTERMDAVLQMGPPVLKPNITVKNDPPDFSSVEQRMDKLIQQVSRLMTPFNPKGGDGEPAAPRAPGPIVIDPNPINLELFNTVHVPEWHNVELVPPETDVFYASFFNLGPGHIYMRQDEHPTSLDDPHATTIPSGSGDNTISTPKRIFVLADEGGATISVRLSYIPAT
jgi:hypothetical protein